MDYICLNGEIIPRKRASLSFDNRAFRFGEGLIEEMRSTGIRIPFFKAHFQRLVKGLNVLGIEYLSAFDQDSLLRSIELLIHREKAFNINTIRITFWRCDDKALLSDKDGVQYLIEVEPLDEKKFTINHKGYTSDIFTGGIKVKTTLSPFVTPNALFKIMALRFAQDRNIDSCFITDAEGKVIEEATSNVFFVIGKTIYTPAIASGCTDGIMRRVVLELADKMGFIVAETESLRSSFIFEAEEVFLANDILGIRWIVGYRHKRYRCRVCLDMVDQLNRVFK